MPCEDCKRMKEQLDYAIEFLRTEMEWEYWRAEWLHDDVEQTNCSMENARKLRNFLIECGYNPSR